MSVQSFHTISAAPPLSATPLDVAAATYRELGFSVIPLAGKLPVVPWKEYQTRQATTAEVATWWTNARTTGVGIVTGKCSGLVVVDCDRPEDVAFWQENVPPTGVVVASGGGGRHFYYALPAGEAVRNRAGVLGRKIDVRGEGGFITAPPSLHPCGKRYTFSACQFERLTKFEAGWMDEKKAERIFSPTRATQKVRHAVAYIGKIRAVAGEGGHNRTFRAACKLRDAGLTAEEALAILSDWNETNASPSWTDTELRHKIESAFRRTR